MKSTFVVILCNLSLSIFCQVSIKGPWTFECGASTNTFFKETSSINLRYISPRFKWSYDEGTDDEQKHPDDFRNTRLMIEVIYGPPIRVLCSSFNVQSRLLKYKRLSMDIYGGMKFFFVTGPNFINVPYLRKRELWYMNIGLIFQLNLGVIAPFVDVGGDKIITVGTEFNFHTIYKKTKKRYRLNPRKQNTD